jgi:uncharacterized membrane protein
MFRTYGLTAQGTRYKRGKRWVFPFVLAATVLVLLSLLTWQFSTSPELQRSSREQRATAQIQKVVNDSGLANLVEANVHFPPVNIKGQNTLLGTVYVQRQAGVTQSSEFPRVIGHKTCTSVAGLKPRSGIRLLTNY